jgi:diketogulonate reductase-like aldo/keto reductase
MVRMAAGVRAGELGMGQRPWSMRVYQVCQSLAILLEKLQPVMALLGEIGERYSKTPAQVALRWLMVRASCPFPVRRTGDAASNAEALSFSLVAAEIEALDHATTAWRGRGLTLWGRLSEVLP